MEPAKSPTPANQFEPSAEGAPLKLRVGHILQHHFPYTPTALQAARQLQLVLARLGASQTTYGDRENPAELLASAHERAGHKWNLPLRSWSANVAIYMQRERWSREDVLFVYDPLHLPAVRAHQRVVFVMAGKPWMPGSRRGKDRFRRFLNQVAWRSAACIVATETRGLRACGVEARPGDFLFRRVRPGLWHIPPFVDTELFHPARARERLQAMQPVLFCGELTQRSGFFALVESFQRFALNHPEAALFVVGHAPGAARLQQAMEILKQPGLAAKAFYLGDLPEAAMPEILASSRLAVFPLLRELDYKVVALQAMASGTTALSSSLGGLEDLPTLKCEPTAEGLLQAMENGWANPDLGRHQREQVEEQFGVAQWEKAWMELLREMQG